jgi:hypothetical protein
MRWTRQRFARNGIAGQASACERSTASGREMLQRTAKSCGPDAPMLASSLRMLCWPYRAGHNVSPLMTVAKEPVTGESTK